MYLHSLHVLLTLSLLFMSSCAKQKIDQATDFPATIYTHCPAERLHNRVRRVVLLSPENLSGAHEPFTRDVQHVVAEAIRKQGLYEVIEVADESSPTRCKAWMQSGEFPVSLLCQMNLAYNADAVMFVSVNRVQSVAPVSVDLSVRFVDTVEGILICSVDGQWSMDNPTTLRRALAQNENEFAQLDDSLIAQSFRALLGIVGEDIAGQLGERKQAVACQISGPSRVTLTDAGR